MPPPPEFVVLSEAAPLTTSILEYLDELIGLPDPRSAILARAISQPRDCDGPRLAELTRGGA